MRAMDGSGLRSILLAMSTPLSACPLACGKPGLEVLWVMPNLSVNALNYSESNCGPLSLVSSSGMPHLAKKFFIFSITACVVVLGMCANSMYHE